MAEPTFSAEDIECLKEAIMKKATGKRLTATDLGGRMESYADASLKDLRDLLEDLEGNVATQRSRVFRTRHSKGL